MPNQPKQTSTSHKKLQSKSLYRAQARRTAAMAGQEELKLRQLEGELVDLALVRRGLANVLINQRTILLSLPAQIGRDIDDPEMRVLVVQLADRHVREALEVLSRFDPGDPSEAGEHEDDAGGGDGITSRPMKKRSAKRFKSFTRK